MKKLFLFSAALMMTAVMMAQTISSSTIDFRYCFSTSSEETTTVNCGSYEWGGQTYTASGDYVQNGLTNARGCDSTATLHLTVNDYRIYDTVRYEIEDGQSKVWNNTSYTEAGTYNYSVDNANGCKDYHTMILSVTVPAGMLPKAVFSVSNNGTDTAKVNFSKGNLQYRACISAFGDLKHKTRGSDAYGQWRFAEHQWDYVGGTGNGNSGGNVYLNSTLCTNNSIGATYTGWVDLITFGHSGCNDSSKPYSASDAPCQYNLTGSYINNDCGYYNEIVDGERTAVAGKWRTLTKDEWNYLLNTRKDAANKKGYGTVNDVHGIILLPDVWPSAISFVPSTTTGWSANVYKAETWATMEANGAVFLPLAGRRVDAQTVNLGTSQYDSPAGNYSSSTFTSDHPYILKFTSNSMSMDNSVAKTNGLSIRVVCNK